MEPAEDSLHQSVWRRVLGRGGRKKGGTDRPVWSEDDLKGRKANWHQSREEEKLASISVASPRREREGGEGI